MTKIFYRALKRFLSTPSLCSADHAGFSLRLLAALLSSSTLLSSSALLSSSTLFCSSASAETVQRWQDRSGQWHFGDQAAAKGQRSQPVLIKTPISIIRNDQPASLKPAERPLKKTIKNPAKNSHSARPNNACDELRQQLYDHAGKHKKPGNLQALTARYEHECIAGHYYGS